MDSAFTDFDATLRDGRKVHLRAVRPDDEAELLQSFDRLSPDARYMRFMRAMSQPNLERLRKTLASLPERGASIVATVPAADGIDIVGSASYMILNDPTKCEFAITVLADYGGTGLGRTLMTALIDLAKRRGLKEMEGFVLSDNASMLGLARRLGFKIARDPDDPSIRICTLQLDAASPNSTKP
jgi:RimJ/RimL family protein N-acetyltransferase